MLVDLDRHIVISPGVRGGRAHLAGTRISVEDVVMMHLRLGHALEEIAGRYQLDLAAVFAAMAYYYDHRSEIDRDIEQDDTFAEALRGSNPSLLRSRLKALGGE